MIVIVFYRFSVLFMVDKLLLMRDGWIVVFGLCDEVFEIVRVLNVMLFWWMIK